MMPSLLLKGNRTTHYTGPVPPYHYHIKRSYMLVKYRKATSVNLKKRSTLFKFNLFAFYMLLTFTGIHFIISAYVNVPRSRTIERSVSVNLTIKPRGEFVKSISINRTFLPQLKSPESENNSSLLARTFEVKLKPGLMTLINPTTPKYALTVNGSYHIENKGFCSDEKYLTLLVVILSTVNNFQRRNDVRETWGSSTHYRNYGTVKIMFILGSTQNSSVQRQVEAEFTRNKDILQGSFIDSYKNVSYKSVLGFKWLTERCRNAKYIVKTDDDIVLNIFRIFETDLSKMAIDQYHVYCERRHTSPVVRDKKLKSNVEPHQLRGLINHMPYCHGQYVLFLNDIVPYLFKSASITPFFWIDDVFNYGIVMNNIPGLKYKQINRNDFVSHQKINKQCWIQASPICRYLYIASDQDNQTRAIWSSLDLQYRKH